MRRVTGYGNRVVIVTDTSFELLIAASSPSTKIEPLTTLPSTLLTTSFTNRPSDGALKEYFHAEETLFKCTSSPLAWL